jgi:hypothetical protein
MIKITPGRILGIIPIIGFIVQKFGKKGLPDVYQQKDSEKQNQ